MSVNFTGIKEVQRLVRVAGRWYRDGVRNMEVMVESVSGGSVIIHCSKRLELSL